ncbi:hypothetical protein GGF37_003330 [Kickxella alabastrina]|nr:hypothetical protein GGF37_003330 [Kickxella alabastrina]
MSLAILPSGNNRGNVSLTPSSVLRNAPPFVTSPGASLAKRTRGITMSDLFNLVLVVCLILCHDIKTNIQFYRRLACFGADNIDLVEHLNVPVDQIQRSHRAHRCHISCGCGCNNATAGRGGGDSGLLV